MVLEAKETEVNQDHMGMFKNCITGIKLCGISKFSQSALRSGMQHSCVVKLRNKMQAVSPLLPVMKLVQEDSAVVLSETAVNQNKMMSPL
jgi:hypothetical protein